ncbi:MAG: electron transfer flavoprotein subunit alpha/FixB family protein [Myxococcales bacterium]|nr:electron transfer flavoprotein subunit alpha/FixB family protein [Myxococcales bacterium]
MSGILVLAEHEDGSFKKSAGELLGKAAQLAASVGGDVMAAVVGDAPAAELGALGATKVFQVSGDFAAYDAAAMVDAWHAIVQAASPSVILASAGYVGKDALPRLVARLGTGMGSEVTDLRADGGAVVGRRPMFAGKIYADVTVTGSPAVFSVRPNSFPQPSPSGGSAEVVAVDASCTALTQVVETKAPASSTADLTEAARIVSGGRSLKSSEQFDAVIRPLAASVGATVGASRAAVDAGYAAHNEQVGQTGKTVNPTLYIACGISGAIQHLAGMRTSKVIVAINKDPEAPIFEHATYGIVDDLFEVCPKLTKAFGDL